MGSIGKQARYLGAVLWAVVAIAALALFLAPHTTAMAATEAAIFTRYSITSSSGSNVQGITVDRNGNAWFATGSGTIDRLDRHTGKLRVYNLKNPNAGVSYVKFDRDGNLWFQEYNVPAIGEINPMTGKERDFVISPPKGGKEGPTLMKSAPLHLVTSWAHQAFFEKC